MSSSNSVNYKNISYDDRDTTDLHYTSNWFLTGTWNASNVGQTGTLSSANDLTANVTFTFPVPAVAFYYYGIPRCCGGYYAICVDCDPNNPIFTPIDAVNTLDDGKNPPIVLYSKTFDQPGVHEIILTNQNDTRFGHSQITLDRFDLEVVDDNAAVTVVESPSSFPIQASTTPTASATNATNATPTGAIVGGVVGGIVLVVLVSLLIVLMRRKSRRVYQEGESQPAPFVYAPRVPPATVSSESRMSQSTFTQSASLPAGRHKHWASPSISATSASASASMSASGSGFRREIDAGRILSSAEDDDNLQFGTLPPEYEQVFSGESSSRVAYNNTRSSYSQPSNRYQFPTGKS